MFDVEFVRNLLGLPNPIEPPICRSRQPTRDLAPKPADYPDMGYYAARRLSIGTRRKIRRDVAEIRREARDISGGYPQIA
jgi:hypothetical protein